MARQKRAEPEVSIDSLHPVNDGFVRAFWGKWTEQGVIAQAVLSIVETENWRRGQYLSNAYELVSLSPTTVSGRPLGPLQEETARLLLRKLRERMLDLMKVAGWRSVAITKNGQPIYQYRPAVRAEGVTLPLAPAQLAENETTSQKAAGHANREQQVQAQQTKTYTIYGSEEARKSGREPAYSRKVSAKLIPFRCAICNQEVSEWHFPGQKPTVCAKPACKREAVRRRVQKSREANKKAKTTE